MVRKKVKILNKYGLHTRPATALVNEASKYESEIYIVYNGVRANAKSILGILILAIEPGAEVIIEANGPDEKEAIEKIVSLIARKFDLE
ncbi:MAG: HPr family phosphocarrier protein [Candidatus Neomarinimicrobiota bacterium]|nr:MAG: HPr family phosphocarrier protein [Candidatus Neomarinimicrobiota bacterium]HDN59078.1 HPr family phosphocarrier protein [Candidatus Neomarinimicrobiota bacterium]